MIVKGISGIAHGLGMTITAEGVETQGQAEQLWQAGCEELQGYFFSRPKPAGAVDHGMVASLVPLVVSVRR